MFFYKSTTISMYLFSKLVEVKTNTKIIEIKKKKGPHTDILSLN